MKIKTAALFCASLLIFAVVHARAAEVGAARQHTGSVVAGKGQAVAGATVDCYHYQSPDGFGYWDREPELQQTILTDSKGSFAISFSSGATLVVVKKDGLATAWKTFGTTIPDSPDPIVLTAPATLSGVVVDDNDQRAADAEGGGAGANMGTEKNSTAK